MGDYPVNEGYLVPVAATLMLATAAIWLFYGWRLYWLFITLLTGAAAAIVGWFFVSPHLDPEIQYIAPLLMGMAGAVIAVPLNRVVAFATSGALGALVAVAVAVGFCNVAPDPAAPEILAVAAAGFLAAGIPAAIFVKFLKVLSTAGYGALLAILGVGTIACVLLKETPRIKAEFVIAALIAWVVLTALGTLVQWRSLVIHKAQTQQG